MIQRALRRGATGPRCRPPHSAFIAIVFTLILVPALAAAVVEPLGVFSDVAADAKGYPAGFEVSLWAYGDGYIGTLTYYAGEGGFANTCILRDVVVTPATGAVSFRARMALRERRNDAQFWGPSGELVEFDGVLGENDLSGAFVMDAEGERRRRDFDRRSVVLRRVEDGARFRDYSDWMVVQERQVGHRDIVSARPPEPVTRSLHVGLVGGLVNTVGDGARYFNTEGTYFGLDVLYTFARRYSIGGRASLARWSSNPTRAVSDVAPPGVELVVIDVPEPGYMLEFSPVVRVATGDVAVDRALVFVQASTGLYYLNLESPYAIAWVEGVKLKGRIGTIGNKGFYAGTALGAGVSLRMSESSRFEIYPQYHWAFAGDESAGFFGVAAHFRVEFLHE